MRGFVEGDQRRRMEAGGRTGTSLPGGGCTRGSLCLQACSMRSHSPTKHNTNTSDKQHTQCRRIHATRLFSCSCTRACAKGRAADVTRPLCTPLPPSLASAPSPALRSSVPAPCRRSTLAPLFRRHCIERAATHAASHRKEQRPREQRAQHTQRTAHWTTRLAENARRRDGQLQATTAGATVPSCGGGGGPALSHAGAASAATGSIDQLNRSIRLALTAVLCARCARSTVAQSRAAQPTATPQPGQTAARNAVAAADGANACSTR